MTVELHLTGADEWPNRVRTLIVGAPGVGKTTAAASFPNPIFANAGAGLTSLAQLGKIPFVNIGSEMDLYNLKVALDRPADEREKLFGVPLDTLVVDCLDEFQRVVMAERLIAQGRKEFEYKDWNWISDRLNAIFLGLSQLEMHLVVVCHAKEVFDGEGVKPNIAGAFADGIFQYVDSALLMHAIPTYEVLPIEEPTINGVLGSDITIELKTDAPVSRFFYGSARPYAEWVHTKLAPLPPKIDADDLFSKLEESLYNVNLGDSETHIIDPDNIEEEIVEVEVGEMDTPILTEDIPVHPEDRDSLAAVAGLEGTPEEASEIPGQMTVEEVLALIEEEHPELNLCADCNETVTSETWKDLSNMKFGRTLCGSCFKNQ